MLVEDLADVVEAQQRLDLPVDRRQRDVGGQHARQCLRLVVEVAAADVPVAQRMQGWLLVVTDLLRECAARGEDAAW